MSSGLRFSKWIWGLGVCLMFSLAACQAATPLTAAPTGEALPISPSSTTTPIPQPSATPPPLPSPTATPTIEPTPTPVFYEPAGCWQPPDDYTRVHINDHTLNARTYAMLQQAAKLYGGEIDVAGEAILQGSYLDNTLESQEAYQGGGAVDISVNRLKTSLVLYNDIEPLIRALRTVGFAAWLRQIDNPGLEMDMYIQAIALGDAELSPAAQELISGPSGYLSGYNGLSGIDGELVPDPHGGPVICRWMLEAGYTDMRIPSTTSTSGVAWQERLRQASLAYLAPYPEDADKIARGLNFLDGRRESAENICGPLSAAILRDAGLLPDQAGPVQELKSYWQARPITNGRPWSLFPESDYEVFRYDTPLAEFDFTAWPLQPADFVYTYAKHSGFEHMFVVTEVDSEGRAYTVTNQYQSWANELWGSMLILRYLLYDPNAPGEGIIYNEWSNSRLGMTGQNGFDVLRKRGLEPGSLYEYIVRPGDTLPELAARFGTSFEDLVESNPDLDLANLQIGQQVTIPIPLYQPDPVEPG